jgi:hypothetical protein
MAGASLDVRRPYVVGPGPVRSLADVLSRGLSLPGAQSVLVGDCARTEASVWTQVPGAAHDFAPQSALGYLSLQWLLCRRGELAEEVVVTGTRYVSVLLHATADPRGGRVFMHVCMARAAANPALAGVAMRSIMPCLPYLLDLHHRSAPASTTAVRSPSDPGLACLPLPPAAPDPAPPRACAPGPDHAHTPATRHPGGGLTAQARIRREVRYQAAELFERGMKPPAVARELRVSLRSAYAWQALWRQGGLEALRSKSRNDPHHTPPTTPTPTPTDQSRRPAD